MTPELRTFHLSALPRAITEFEWERYGPIARRFVLDGGTVEQAIQGLEDFGLRMTEQQEDDLRARPVSTAQIDLEVRAGGPRALTAGNHRGQGFQGPRVPPACDAQLASAAGPRCLEQPERHGGPAPCEPKPDMVQDRGAGRVTSCAGGGVNGSPGHPPSAGDAKSRNARSTDSESVSDVGSTPTASIYEA